MEYKRKVLELLAELDDRDIVFLCQLYTLIKRHIEKRKSR